MKIPITEINKSPKWTLTAEETNDIRDGLHNTTHYFDSKTYGSPSLAPANEYDKQRSLPKRKTVGTPIGKPSCFPPANSEPNYEECSKAGVPTDFPPPKTFNITPFGLATIAVFVAFFLGLGISIIANESRNGALISGLQEIHQDKQQLQFLQSRIRADVSESSQIVDRMDIRASTLVDKFENIMDVKESKIINQ